MRRGEEKDWLRGRPSLRDWFKNFPTLKYASKRDFFCLIQLLDSVAWVLELVLLLELAALPRLSEGRWRVGWDECRESSALNTEARRVSRFPYSTSSAP